MAGGIEEKPQYEKNSENTEIRALSKKYREPWLMWLSGLSAGLPAEGLLVDSQSGHMPGLWAGSLVGGA